MNAKHLRIGNYLNDREGNLCEVIELGKNSIYAPSLNKYTTKLPNKPIPLTEEWLLKFGFNKGFNTLFKQINGFGREVTISIEFNGMDDIAIWTTENDGTESETNSTFNIENNLKYVHQLQNLYFTITGTELEIKELAK